MGCLVLTAWALVLLCHPDEQEVNATTLYGINSLSDKNEDLRYTRISNLSCLFSIKFSHGPRTGRFMLCLELIKGTLLYL
jgi:hypothetical protein